MCNAANYYSEAQRQARREANIAYVQRLMKESAPAPSYGKDMAYRQPVRQSDRCGEQNNRILSKRREQPLCNCCNHEDSVLDWQDRDLSNIEWQDSVKLDRRDKSLGGLGLLDRPGSRYCPHSAQLATQTCYPCQKNKPEPRKWSVCASRNPAQDTPKPYSRQQVERYHELRKMDYRLLCSNMVMGPWRNFPEYFPADWDFDAGRTK